MLTKFKTIFKVFFIKLKPMASGLGFVILFLVLSMSSFAFYDSYKNREFGDPTAADTDKINTTEEITCNVPIIKINGRIAQYKTNKEGEWTDESVVGDILTALDTIEKDKDVKGVILQINSSGGSGTAGQEVAKTLKRIKIPTVALIKEQGLSAAYYIASGASHIIASNLSDVGSIGVTMSYVSNIKKDVKDGYEFNSLSTGIYKDSGSIDKPLTADEKVMFMKSLNKAHDIFVGDVARNRNLDVSKVAKMADGSSMTGDDALKVGLIDQIGDLFTAKEYIKGIIGEEVNTCEY